MDNSKVFSMLNNVKMFLSTEEMKQLAFCIEQDCGKKVVTPKFKMSKELQEWTLVNVTENLRATYFKPKKRR